MASNPFAALFPNITIAQYYVASQVHSKLVEEEKIEVEFHDTEPVKIELPNDEEVKEVQELNNIIEEIFLVTLNKFSVLGGDQKQLVYLSSLADIIGRNNLLKANYDNAALLQVLTTRHGLTCNCWSRLCLRE